MNAIKWQNNLRRPKEFFRDRNWRIADEKSWQASLFRGSCDTGTLNLCSIFGVSSKYGDIDRTYIKGADDIRWGIDIRGGVDVTFSPPEGVDATDEEMSAAESVIKTRLLNQNITDSEVYTDTNTDRIIVRFPWKSNEQDFNPEAAIEELGKTAQLAFYKDVPIDQTTGLLSANAGEPVLTGADVEKAEFVMQQDPTTGVSQPVVSLVLKDEAKENGQKQPKNRLANRSPSSWMTKLFLLQP